MSDVILVTGGAGFIGTNFSKMWLENHRSDHLICFDKISKTSSVKELDLLKRNAQFKFIKGDILDFELVRSTIKGVDILVHFAAETHVDRSIANPFLFTKVNVKGTQVLLEASRDTSLKRFHYVSTDEVFGFLGASGRFNEDKPISPKNPYAASKAGAECLCFAYLNTFDIPLTVSNGANTYGPYQYPDKLIPKFIVKAVKGEKLPVYGKGNQVREWLYVEDHCRAIETILKRGKIGERYCVGSGEERTNLEITLRILQLAGRPSLLIEHVEDRRGSDFRYAVDTSKLQSLGWKPKIFLDEGLQRTFDWISQNLDYWE